MLVTQVTQDHHTSGGDLSSRWILCDSDGDDDDGDGDGDEDGDDDEDDDDDVSRVVPVDWK